MRSLVIAICLSALSLATSGAAHAASVVRVNVPDMVCEGCSGALIHNFEKRAEVASAVADIKTHELTLTLKDAASLSDADIQKTVADTGFTATSIAR